MQERIAEETTGSEGEEDLKARLHGLCVVQRDDVEDEERGHGDENSGAQGVQPNV